MQLKVSLEAAAEYVGRHVRKKFSEGFFRGQVVEVSSELVDHRRRGPFFRVVWVTSGDPGARAAVPLAGRAWTRGIARHASRASRKAPPPG